MAKITLDISLDRLSMAQEYDLDLSDVCSQAIEREMRARAPLLRLTPRARGLLFRAQRVAERWGHTYIGEEHLALAMLVDGSIPGQTARHLGIAQPLTDALEETMRSVGYNTPTNRVADTHGTPLGFMYLNADGHPYVGDAESKPIGIAPTDTPKEGATGPSAANPQVTGSPVPEGGDNDN